MKNYKKMLLHSDLIEILEEYEIPDERAVCRLVKYVIRRMNLSKYTGFAQGLLSGIIVLIIILLII